MRQILKNKRGFTLVEFVVILFILTTISAIIVGVVYSVLRGSSRSQATVDVSSSGNYALSVISNLVTSGEDVLEVGGSVVDNCIDEPSGDSIQILSGDGGITTLACENETIASNGASLIDDFELMVVPGSCSFVCKQNSAFVPPLVETRFSIQPRVYEFATDEVIETFRSSSVLRNHSY